MKKNKLMMVMVLFCGALSLAGTGFESTPDLEQSRFEAVDAVGDILGDGGQVGLTLRDTKGLLLPGVAVRLTVESGEATLATVNGKTDEYGRFESFLFSKVQTVAVVRAEVDTDADGVVDSTLAQRTTVAFIDSLALNTGVGINIDTPDDSAVLHLNSSNRGVMIPRVALQGCSDRVTIPDPATSLLVFNTNASDSLKVGYAYFNGTDWVNFLFD